MKADFDKLAHNLAQESDIVKQQTEAQKKEDETKINMFKENSIAQNLEGPGAAVKSLAQLQEKQKSLDKDIDNVYDLENSLENELKGNVISAGSLAELPTFKDAELSATKKFVSTSLGQLDKTLGDYKTMVKSYEEEADAKKQQGDNGPIAKERTDQEKNDMAAELQLPRV